MAVLVFVQFVITDHSLYQNLTVRCNLFDQDRKITSFFLLYHHSFIYIIAWLVGCNDYLGFV